MVLKIKNRDYGSWTFIDNVDKVSTIQCIVSDPENEEQAFTIKTMDGKTTMTIDYWLMWPIEIGNNVNVLFVETGGEFKAYLTEREEAFILGSDGKTLDRI